MIFEMVDEQSAELGDPGCQSAVRLDDDSEFRSAAIRLRLGHVTNATLVLLGMPFQTWSNGRGIGRLSGITEIVTAHVNTAGLHR